MLYKADRIIVTLRTPVGAGRLVHWVHARARSCSGNLTRGTRLAHAEPFLCECARGTVHALRVVRAGRLPGWTCETSSLPFRRLVLSCRSLPARGALTIFSLLSQLL